jgi:hypothetical protein
MNKGIEDVKLGGMYRDVFGSSTSLHKVNMVDKQDRVWYQDVWAGGFYK